MLNITYVGYEPYESLLKLRQDTAVYITLNESATISEAVIVSAVRASQNTPTTFKTLNKEDISRKNLGQDLPYMLSHEPSVVAILTAKITLQAIGFCQEINPARMKINVIIFFMF